MGRPARHPARAGGGEVIRHAYDLARAQVHRRVDAAASEAVLEIQAQAKAARAFINRRAKQRIRRLEERLSYGVV